MAVRRPVVAGNWKMNGSRSDAAALVDGILRGVSAAGNVEILVCPPFVLIPSVGEKLAQAGGRIGLGGQNLHNQANGAFTGEVSGPMLRDAGCQYVLIGHSERRTLFGESDDVVEQKFVAAQAAGLIPILCIGETLAERETNRTEEVVGRQLDAVLERHGANVLTKAVIAYEPVWAIGTGRTATPAQAQAVHQFIRARIAVRDANVANGVRILYGGSVKGANAAELFGQADIDGGLIGGASLQAEEFLAICKAAVK